MLRIPSLNKTPEPTPKPFSSGRRRVRVLLEGREVPVVSVSATFNPDMPSVANIELVPLQVIKFIKPRTQVSVFVQDQMMFGDLKFRLCMEGEVLGRSMVKRHDGRAFRITIFDYTNYLDDAKAFIMNPNFVAGKLPEAVMYGEPPPGTQAKANAGSVMSTAANANSLMLDLLRKYKDPAGGPDIVRGVAEVARKLASVNEFYRSHYERLRITDRIFVYSSGRLGQFLGRLKIEEFLASYTGAQGGMTSLRQMLMGVLSLFFHTQISVPFPSFVKATRGKQTGYSIANFLIIPDTYLLPPPRCNVVFPSQQIGFEFDEDFRAVPTRYGFRASFPMPAGNEIVTPTYPIQYYPRTFADYMFGRKNGRGTATLSQLLSAFGPSQILKSKDGRNYANIFYGGASKDKSIGPSYAPTLREADFLTNEESLKGIYYETDTLVPAYSALVRAGSVTKVDENGNAAELAADGVSSQSRNDFMAEVGGYLFFKKRYAARAVSATIDFNPYIVPGFTAVFLDDSDAGQSFIAKVDNITHNMTHTGFQTILSLSQGRDFDEIDFISGGTGDPPLPKWFDTSVFGLTEKTKTLFNQETKYLGPVIKDKTNKSNGSLGIIDQVEVDYRNKKVTEPTVFPELSKFYQKLLGCDSITGLGPVPPSTSKNQVRQVLVTTRGAVMWLIHQYKTKGNQAVRDIFVRDYISRPIPDMEEAMAFVGAEIESAPGSGESTKVPDQFARFVAIKDSKRTGLPGRFDGTGYSDETILQIRREVIDEYVRQLQTRRGFRG